MGFGLYFDLLVQLQVADLPNALPASPRHPLPLPHRHTRTALTRSRGQFCATIPRQVAALLVACATFSNWITARKYSGSQAAQNLARPLFSLALYLSLTL